MGLGNPTSLPGRVAARDSIPVPRVQHRKGPPTHILAAESKFDDVRCARWASAARVPFDCWLRSSFRMTGAPAGLAVLPLRTIMVSLGPFLTHMCSRISPRCRRIMGGFKSKASTLPSRDLPLEQLNRRTRARQSVRRDRVAARSHLVHRQHRQLTDRTRSGRCCAAAFAAAAFSAAAFSAKEDLEAGQLISHASTTIRLSALVLEGHRFAVAPIGLGELITSWGEPFRCLACSTERLRQRIWPPQRAFRFGAPLSRRSTPSSRDGVE